ncbi:sensor histidine kinase [Paenactinomyces guangxiensis]|uniref:Histidine kinase n=1 Tax=Paenactinomyces guangxiensis TaxID=1490290 RepID=A0A7W1WPS4_9BACL|nr:histidine kinase [Paenactinomyces guangxiensis]MBA4493824.1 histidine kinase [Paenactinomyces guangxiensis]MBH8591290.1 histidine kinase [Paenactinomyces guangxiensis]
MIRLKFKTLQQKLFAYYSAFFIGFIIIIGLLLFIYFVNYTKNNVSAQQKQLSTSIASFLDQEITKMNNFSMNIVYSNIVKEHFNHDLSPITYQKSNLSSHTPEMYKNVTTLIDVILSIISSSETARQANIYDFNGRMVGAGYFNGELSVELQKKPWYAETMKKDGSKYISMIKSHDLPPQLQNSKRDQKFIALTRVYKNSNYTSQGIIEILQDCDKLFKYLNDLRKTNANLKIYVIDSDGNFFYPYNSDEDKKEGIYYKNLITMQRLGPETTHQITSPVTHDHQLMTYAVLDQTGWTVIITQSQKELFSYLDQLSKIFFLLTLITLLFILIISYMLSKKMTLPLKRLQKAIRKLDIDDLSKSDFPVVNEEKSSIAEIDDLNRAFNKMNKKLSHSFKELLISRSKELDAKFLALQSQMNPHFLYNNLTNIRVMAEEGMNDQIVTLCDNISFMLRYISAQNKKGVSLESEIDYTKRYLDCMKIRYEENLTYHFDIPEQMYDLTVPRLIIQPLVENSIKYGLDTPPPWSIFVHGTIENEKWRITVSDNGPGMDPSVRKQFYDFMNSSKDILHTPDLQINGMGLKNIFIRLKLMFQDDACFEIKNLDDRGLSVTIGGHVHSKEGIGNHEAHLAN